MDSSSAYNVETGSCGWEKAADHETLENYPLSLQTTLSRSFPGERLAHFPMVMGVRWLTDISMYLTLDLLTGADQTCLLFTQEIVHLHQLAAFLSSAHASVT